MGIFFNRNNLATHEVQSGTYELQEQTNTPAQPSASTPIGQISLDSRLVGLSGAPRSRSPSAGVSQPGELRSAPPLFSPQRDAVGNPDFDMDVPRFATTFTVTSQGLVELPRQWYEEKRAQQGKAVKPLPDRTYSPVTLKTGAYTGGPRERTYRLEPGQSFKIFGYDTFWGPTSAGTSRAHVLCLTGGMSSCVAVAVGGVSPNKEESKIRVFHVPAGESAEEIDEHIMRLHEEGLTTITAAMHGGPIDGADYTPDDDEINESSNETAQHIRSVLDSRDVSIAFDETRGQRLADTTLGAVIVPNDRNEMTISFITHALLPDQKQIHLLDE